MDLLQLQLQIILGLLFAAAQKTSGQVTEAPGATVTYNPGEECFPYDGSVVPDCTLFIDPNIKQPYYHEHSTNCSRFWECGPDGETCLVECAHCGDESNQQCHYHEDNHYMPALAFDVTKQFPDGPVCNWPSDTTLRCHSNCTINDECCHNDACDKCPNGHCNLDWTCSYPDNCCTSDSDCNDSDKCPGGTCNTDGTCSYPEDCCTSNSDCLHFDGICNVPAPHNQDNCAFCDNGQCAGGCANLGSDSTNCPSTHPNCNGSHECEEPKCPPNAECCEDSECSKCPGGTCNPDYTCAYPPDCCSTDSDCDNYDGMCNVPEAPTIDNCAYCDNHLCTAGCAELGDLSANCPSTHPICNGTHVCDTPPDECQTDPDCNEALGHSGICDSDVAEQTECWYCDSEAGRKVCKPGCQHDSDTGLLPRCPENQPTCNTDTHNCQAKPGSILLTSMVFTSKGCDGCYQEGVNVTLTGSLGISPRPRCKIIDLDHQSVPDFSLTSTFNATTEELNIGWGNCWKAALEGSVSAANVAWTGKGTWSPVKICFDFENEDSLVSECEFEADTTLTNDGTEVSLSCAYIDKWDC